MNTYELRLLLHHAFVLVGRGAAHWSKRIAICSDLGQLFHHAETWGKHDTRPQLGVHGCYECCEAIHELLR